MVAKNAIGGGKPIKSAGDLRPIERRILEYLDQRGATHRQTMVSDLASPNSRIGQGIMRGSNSFIPAIAARWCARLKAGYFIGQSRDDVLSITISGRMLMRKRAE